MFVFCLWITLPMPPKTRHVQTLGLLCCRSAFNDRVCSTSPPRSLCDAASSTALLHLSPCKATPQASGITLTLLLSTIISGKDRMQLRQRPRLPPRRARRVMFCASALARYHATRRSLLRPALRQLPSIVMSLNEEAPPPYLCILACCIQTSRSML